MWQPLLEGSAADRAHEALDDIARALREDPGNRSGRPGLAGRSFSLAGGLSGLALFYAYLDQARPEHGHGDFAVEQLEAAIDGIGESLAFAGLYSGFSGVAWTLEHLRGVLFDESEEDEDPGEEVAGVLKDHLGTSPWRLDYDLISGLAGFGVYAVERMPRPWGRECLEEVVARLAENAERKPEGTTWLTPPELLPERDRGTYPNGLYNLGVAHGVPGIVPILAEAVVAGLDAEALLEQSVGWLLANRLPAENPSSFAYSVAEGIESRPTRVAWCYGDLGASAALLTTARLVGNRKWEEAAVEVGRKVAARAVSDAGVIDAGLCHGGLGNAHLYNRLYQATGVEDFATAARTWYAWGLDFRKPGEGIGGYQSWSPDENLDLKWTDDEGFLTGSAGIGLALLAGVSSVRPGWDRVLLAAVPEG
jgi:lantibiotic modifying enzyme